MRKRPQAGVKPGSLGEGKPHGSQPRRLGHLLEMLRCIAKQLKIDKCISLNQLSGK